MAGLMAVKMAVKVMDERPDDDASSKLDGMGHLAGTR
jgi:hypothetical protein